MALFLTSKNGFHLISFEKIGVLDSYFIHRYIIIKYRSGWIKGKLHQILLSYCPFSTSKNSFRLISFEEISVLESYFIHQYIILKYRSGWIKDKIYKVLWEFWPVFIFKKWFLFDIF